MQTACLWEVCSRKPGNVHPRAEFTDVGLIDFVLSAAAVGHAIAGCRRRPLGTAIRKLVEATRAVTTSNTNLGIILLLVPLTRAYPDDEPAEPVGAILDRTTVADAREVYEAIRLARPGGLGRVADQDVSDPTSEPTVTLTEAMRRAADRDLIARQYATGFADVFDFGLPALLDAYGRYGCIEAAVVDTHLRWLATYPDSLIARKNGRRVAEQVRARAAEVLDRGGIATPEGRRAAIDLDRYLRSDGHRLNPGTTADLLTACLFVALRENKLVPTMPFRWHAPDWL